MCASLTTIVALTILGGPLGVSHEAQLCALAQKCKEIRLEVHPLRMTASMACFVSQHVDRHHSHDNRLRQLVWAVRHPQVLGFRYEPDETRTAADAFASRSGDCVSFSLMFVALARHAGLDARFQLVRCRKAGRDSRGLNAAMRHMNVVVFLPRGRAEIDVTQPICNAGPRKRRHALESKIVVFDRLAFAAFFNNCCVENISLGDYLRADRFSRAAINLAPECVESWVNFGVCQRLLGKFKTAEAAYLRALSYESKCQVAKDNLALLRRMTKSILVNSDRLDTPVGSKTEAKKGLQKSTYDMTLVAATSLNGQ